MSSLRRPAVRLLGGKDDARHDQGVDNGFCVVDCAEPLVAQPVLGGLLRIADHPCDAHADVTVCVEQFDQPHRLVIGADDGDGAPIPALLASVTQPGSEP